MSKLSSSLSSLDAIAQQALGIAAEKEQTEQRKEKVSRFLLWLGMAYSILIIACAGGFLFDIVAIFTSRAQAQHAFMAVLVGIAVVGLVVLFLSALVQGYLDDEIATLADRYRQLVAYHAQLSKSSAEPSTEQTEEDAA